MSKDVFLPPLSCGCQIGPHDMIGGHLLLLAAATE